MIDTLLFDLDGTLLKTDFSFVRHLVNKSLEIIGMPPAGDEEINRFWFHGNRDATIRNGFSASPAAFWAAFRSIDRPEVRIRHVTPYDDVEFLDVLKKKGFKLGVVTGTSLRILDMELELLGKEKFDAVVHAHLSSGNRHKPHPDGIFKCLELLGSVPEKSVFVGNSEEDYYASRNAGIKGFLVDRKEHDISYLNAPTVENLYELKSVLDL